GASAIAQVDFSSGTVTNILVTNPGSGYTIGDVMTVTFIGGAGSGADANTFVLAANHSGALTKLGNGVLTLSGPNTHYGTTTIGAGTLALGTGGSLASTNISVSTGTIFDVSGITGFSLTGTQSLFGSGTVTGSVSLATSSKIFPGTDGGIGTLTFNND